MHARTLVVHCLGLFLVLAAASAARTTSQDEGSEPRLVLETLDGDRRTRPTGAGPITSLAAIGAAFVHFEDVPAGTGADARISPTDLGSFELAGATVWPGPSAAGTEIC